MNVSLLNASLQGTITDAYIQLINSRWTATGDSAVCLVGKTAVESMDALAGVTICAVAGEGCSLQGQYTLASGGKLVVA
jgi:hypothetical protein